MITLKYLEELGTFTLDLIKNLKNKNDDVPYLKLVRYSRIWVYSYSAKLIISLSKSSTDINRTQKTISSMNYARHDSNKVTLIHNSTIKYTRELSNYEEYSTTEILENFFSLSTVLDDIQFIELYLSKLAQGELKDDDNHFLINPYLLNQHFEMMHKVKVTNE